MEKVLAGLMIMFVTIIFGCGGSGGGSDTGGSSSVNSDTVTADSSSSTSGSNGDVAGSGNGSSTAATSTDSSGSGTGSTTTTASDSDSDSGSGSGSSSSSSSSSSTGASVGGDASGSTADTGGDSGGGVTPVVNLPTAPSEVVVTPGNGQVSVSWKGVADATSYNLYWATSAGVTPGSATKNTGVTSPCVLTGFTNWTMYYFVMTALNAHGESAVSNETSAIPIALFDEGMLRGKTFDYSLTTGATGIVTFSADGTFAGQNHTASSPFGGNWVVKNGVLLCLYTGGIMETMMLKDNTPTSFLFTYAVTFADGSNGTSVEGTFVQAE